jgi:hypothetical protein
LAWNSRRIDDFAGEELRFVSSSDAASPAVRRVPVVFEGRAGGARVLPSPSALSENVAHQFFRSIARRFDDDRSRTPLPSQVD